MIDSLKWAMPNSRITVASLTPNVDCSHYSVDVVGVLNELTEVAESGRKAGILSLIRAGFSVFCLISCATLYRSLEIKPSVLRGNDLSFFKKCAEADIILSCGGAFLNDNSLIRFLVHLFQLFFAVMMAKPVVLYGQSIGPFKRVIPSLLTRLVLNRTKLIILREPLSRDWLERIGVNKPSIYVTADPSFAMDLCNLDSSRQISLQESLGKQDSPMTGISIRRWHFPSCSNPKERYQNYLSVMANVVNYLIEKVGSTVVLIPMCTSPNKEENDYSAMNEMLPKVKNREKVRIITSDYSPEELAAIIGCMNIFIGTRMHANILALLKGIPLIAIAYEPKTEGIMKLMDLEKWVLRIESIQLNELLHKVNEIWRHQETIGKKFSAEAMVQRSRFSAVLVKRFLYQL